MLKLLRDIFCVSQLLFCGGVAAQGSYNFDKVWVQGQSINYTTTFNGVALPLNQTMGPAGLLYFSKGHSNICDSEGKLVLLCDGFNLYDNKRALLDGGKELVPSAYYNEHDGFTNYSQTSIILPFDNGIYRVITPAVSDSEMINYWGGPKGNRAVFDLLLYSEVDMNANGGAGKVAKRMVPLLQDVQLSKTQMMACRHGDGKSWWLLKHASDTNVIYSFLFTDSMIYGPYIQGFQEPHFTKWDICGQAMFSADATKYATTIQGFRKVFLADFDRCSGKLSNPETVDVPMQLTHDPTNPTQGDSSTCGLAFSPSGRFLYVNGFFSVQQLDLQDNNPSTRWTTIGGLDTTWDEFQSYSNIYPSSDGRLYVGNWGGLGGQMSVINNPDAKGVAADFCPKCLRFPSYLFQGISRFFCVSAPPCMPNYHLGPTNQLCNPTGIQGLTAKQSRLKLYPNPVNDQLHVEYDEAGVLELSDMAGRKLRSIVLGNIGGGKTIIELKGFQAGLCVCCYYVDGRLVETRKLIVGL